MTIATGEEAHAPPPSDTTAAVSAGLLFATLVAIVGLAKSLTPTLEIGIARLDVPKPVVGIVIAALVLLPEGLAVHPPLRVRDPHAVNFVLAPTGDHALGGRRREPAAHKLDDLRSREAVRA
jgi:hypothetical protein